jgi:hypothetical protein
MECKRRAEGGFASDQSAAKGGGTSLSLMDPALMTEASQKNGGKLFIACSKQDE